MISTRTPQTNAPAVKPAEKDEERSPDLSSSRGLENELFGCIEPFGTSKSELLLYGWFYQTECLSVQQVEEIAEAAEKEDVPLVLAHAMRIKLAIHKQGLLLIQRESFQLWIIQYCMAGFKPIKGRICAFDILKIFVVGHGLTINKERSELVRKVGRCPRGGR